MAEISFDLFAVHQFGGSRHGPFFLVPEPAVVDLEPGSSPPPALRELVTLLNLDLEQREMFQKMFSVHRQNMQVWHREMALKRQDLLALMKDGSTTWPDFQAKLKELSDIQAKREEASLDFFLQLRQRLKPEQQVTCNNFMECRLLQGQGEKGEWCKVQGIHRPQGRGRRRAPAAPSHSPSESGEVQQ